MKKHLIAVAGTALLVGSMVLPTMLSAAPPLNLGLNEVQNSISLGKQDIRATIASIINVALGLLGIVAVCIILLGGFKWMVSQGEEEKVKQAKNLIIQGIVGLVIILSAWAIARFVVDSLITATT
ncbi:MAG: pilin [bacterium]